MTLAEMIPVPSWATGVINGSDPKKRLFVKGNSVYHPGNPGRAIAYTEKGIAYSIFNSDPLGKIEPVQRGN